MLLGHATSVAIAVTMLIAIVAVGLAIESEVGSGWALFEPMARLAPQNWSAFSKVLQEQPALSKLITTGEADATTVASHFIMHQLKEQVDHVLVHQRARRSLAGNGQADSASSRSDGDRDHRDGVAARESQTESYLGIEARVHIGRSSEVGPGASSASSAADADDVNVPPEIRRQSWQQ